MEYMAIRTKKAAAFRKLGIWDTLGTYRPRTRVALGQKSTISAERTKLDPATLELWGANDKKGREHTIAAVLGLALSSIADNLSTKSQEDYTPLKMIANACSTYKHYEFTPFCNVL